MNLKTFFKAMSIKARSGRALGKKFAKSYVSLFLVLLLGVTSTLAWFTQRQDAEVKSNNLEFQSSSSLRINKDKSLSNKITIEDVVLDEASSVDGRNIYFPLGESFTGDTENMFFREGNMGDENNRYVYKDFELKGTSGNTPVYIKGYQIKITDGDSVHDTEVNGVYEDELIINYDSSGKPKSQTLPPDCPIRLAFISDSGTKPVVIDPSAMVIDYVENSNAVTLIDDNGVPMTETTNADSFASYYYGKTPLFIIPGGQNLPVTLVIWLEGTLPNCDKYIGKKISVDIDIESNFAEMETITFVDGTKPDSDGGQEHWVSNDNPIIACSYENPYSDATPKRWKTVIMSRVSNNASDPGYYQWTCKIPKKAVTNIAFFRLSAAKDKDEKKGTIYNSWRTAENVNSMLNPSINNSWFKSGSKDLQNSRQTTDSDGNKYNGLVYTAIHGNGYGLVDKGDPLIQEKRLSPCVGYWNYGSSSSGGDIKPTDPDNTKPSAGGGSSICKIGVYLNVPENKTWVYIYGSQLWVVTEKGKAFQMVSDGDKRFKAEGCEIEAGDFIVYIGLKNPGEAKYYTSLYLSPSFEVTRDYNVTFTINNEDRIVLN